MFKLQIEFDVEKIPIKLQYDTCNSWGDVTFTRQLDLELNVQKVTQGQHWTHPRFWCQHPYINLQHDRGNLWSYHVHNMLPDTAHPRRQQYPLPAWDADVKTMFSSGRVNSTQTFFFKELIVISSTYCSSITIIICLQTSIRYGSQIW